MGRKGQAKVVETREELLARAAVERALRHQAKAQVKAAGAIQKVWRGVRARGKLRDEVARSWDAAFANHGDEGIGAKTQRDQLLIPLNFLLEPLCGATAATSSSSSSSSSSSEEELALLQQGLLRTRVAIGLVLKGLDQPKAFNVSALALAEEAEERRLFLGVLLKFFHRLSRIVGRLRQASRRDLLLETGALKLLCDLTTAAPKCCESTEEASRMEAANRSLLLGLCANGAAENLLRAVVLLEDTVRKTYNEPGGGQSTRKLALAYCNRVIGRLAALKGGDDSGIRCLKLSVALLTVPRLQIQAGAVFGELMGAKCREALVVGPLTCAGFPAAFAALSPRAKASLVTNILPIACESAHREVASALARGGHPIVALLQTCIGGLTADPSGAAKLEAMVDADAFGPLLTPCVLETLLGDPPRPEALPSVADLYLVVIESFGKMAAREVGRVTSFIAFSRTKILRMIWLWLGTELSLPREAPMEATKGWLPQALIHRHHPKFIGTISPECVRMLMLFTKAFQHLLKVVDDHELYEEQKPFSLAELRAVSCSMNSLLCCSILCGNGGQGEGQKVRGPLSEAETALLSDVSLLVSLLHERDCKKRFCPPSLWLGPISEGPKEWRLEASPALARQLLALDPEAGPSAGAPLARLLAVAPQCFPFEQRVVLFQEVVKADREVGGWNKAPALGGQRPSICTIRRQFLLEDALAEFAKLGSRAKGRVEIKFVNEAGLSEAGMDYGGLLKEFLEEVAKRGFDPNLAIFKATGEGCLHPSHLAEFMDGGLALLYLMGMVVGKCLYDGILLDIRLANFFVSSLLGANVDLEDLRSYDADLYHQILNVKTYEGDAEDLGLFFAVEDDIFGRHVVNELIEGGEDVAVTSSNVNLYVHLVANFYLNRQGSRSAGAFRKGLLQLVSPGWLRMFSSRDLNDLLSGPGHSDIDVDDLRRHTKYSNGYSEKSPTVVLFWKVLKSASVEERRAVMKFVTSSSRSPVLGFASLNPPFCLSKVKCETGMFASLGLGKDADRLPSASTCFNTLKLPNFKSAKVLRQKLMYAAMSGAGFELS